MPKPTRRPLSRRKALTLVAAAPLPFLVSCGDDDDDTVAAPATTPTTTPPPEAATSVVASPSAAPANTRAATPACVDDDDPTPAQTEGPYFTPDSPERTVLFEEGMAGTRLLLTGFVISTNCEPVSGALVDFWQADDAGEYDNEGYTLRGHQFTGEDGAYSLETVVPGLYPGRTRHIHVKVQASGSAVLTTQLYFPGEPRNASDGIFREECLINLVDADGAATGTFDFVLEP